MDRLETYQNSSKLDGYLKFIFQYGQIRNFSFKNATKRINRIYIPVWIDQKPFFTYILSIKKIIYIPVWIDQKLTLPKIAEYLTL